jgi:uncharacterized protein YegL
MSLTEPEGLPLANVSRRQLNIIFAVDCSGSMAGEKINSLNMAMRIAEKDLRKAAASNVSVDMVVRVLRFSTGASWHIEGPVPVGEFEWKDLAVDRGETDMGCALDLIANILPTLSAQARQLPPLIVLISDGYPSDDFDAGRRALMATAAGAKAVREAIAIGSDVDLDTLQQFIADPRFKPLQAHNAAQIVDHIRWVSSELLSQHSQGTDSKVRLQKAEAEVETQAAPPGTKSDLIW